MKLLMPFMKYEFELSEEHLGRLELLRENTFNRRKLTWSKTTKEFIGDINPEGFNLIVAHRKGSKFTIKAKFGMQPGKGFLYILPKWKTTIYSGIWLLIVSYWIINGLNEKGLEVSLNKIGFLFLVFIMMLIFSFIIPFRHMKKKGVYRLMEILGIEDLKKMSV